LFNQHFVAINIGQSSFYDKVGQNYTFGTLALEDSNEWVVSNGRI